MNKNIADLMMVVLLCIMAGIMLVLLMGCGDTNISSTSTGGASNQEQTTPVASETDTVPEEAPAE